MTATTLTVQYALACLKALDAQPQVTHTPRSLSRAQGVPYADCLFLIDQLINAGLLVAQDDGVVLGKPLAEMAATEILQAIWATPKRTVSFRPLVAAQGSTIEALRSAAATAQDLTMYPGDGAYSRGPDGTAIEPSQKQRGAVGRNHVRYEACN